MRSDLPTEAKYISGDPSNKGYKPEEAEQFIEFCVELDSQDDRMKDPTNPHFMPQIDPELWNPVPIYDSRQAVAKDVIAFRDTGETPANKGWAKLYREILDRAADQSKTPPETWTAQSLAADPRFNGFGAYQTAWILYEGRNRYAGSYAIAIRGTVIAAMPSVVEDVLFHPVQAQHFLADSVSFASFKSASLHSGFAHATFSLLLDDRYGVLRVLNDLNVPVNSRMYIVGHSQGAAMATLTHAFLHYGGKNSTAGKNDFGLYGKNYLLKSYVFAQPKPGNFAFAADFASITQGLDNAIVINNDIDAVTQVPLTLQDVGDLEGDLPGSSVAGRLLHYVSGIGGGLRGLVGRIAEPFVKNDNAGFGYYYNYERLGPIGKDKTASSWNFVPAGHVLMVYGKQGDPKDAFAQHHAWMYRNLIKAQL